MQEIPIRSFGVSVIVVRKRGGMDEVLMLRRTGSLCGEWCQVAGGIEAGERAWETALRELSEETGLTPISLFSGDICEQFYEADRDAITIFPVFVAYVASDAEVRLNDEHSEFRWVTFEEARRMVPFAGQRNVLRHVEAEFVLREPSRYLEIKIG